MIYPHLSGIHYESIADGPGVRTAIYLSGCNHNCPECHNPQTHDPLFGTEINEKMMDNIALNIMKRRFLSGITLTGGDPLFDVEATYRFLYALCNRLGERWHDLNVWLYTGYTWSQLVQRCATDDVLRKLLSMIDVVVDGPFIPSLADKRLTFCGSSNQNLIDVKKSMHLGVPILYNSSNEEVLEHG